MTAWSAERAEEHLLGLELFGMRFGLERMRRLLTALGSPQERFAAIHVVGTNGKSSTVRMTAALLEAHGVRAGAFLSPHLTSFAERIRIGDRDLEPDAFGAAVQRAAAAAAKVDRGLEPGDRVTQFELITAAAFDELARREVDVAVVEAGLGGRHDATGVLRAPVVVLTNVGLEHTRWLGPTVPDIARREACGGASRAPLLVLGDADPEVEALAARHRRADRAAGARSQTALPGYQRTNFAVACAAARGRLGALDARRRGARRGADHRARAAPGRRRAPADDPRRRAQPERRRRRWWRRSPSARSSRSSRSSTTRTRRRCCARCCRAARRSSAPPRPTRGRCRRRRWPRWSRSSGPTAEIVPAPRAALDRARELAGPEGAVIVTGSIYLIAELALGSGAPEGLCAVNDRGPSVLGMIALVAVVVALTILIFFALGYAFGRMFL